MFSRLDPSFLYEDVTPDITENDIDVVSDLWEMDGRDVYRGSRDPRYTHANVYWLYDEDLVRVGCSEHDVKDHGNFRVLWFHESEFGTLLQEDGWTVGNDIWSIFPSHVFDRAMNEGWTTPDPLLEQCLYGQFRIVTPSMLIQPKSVFVCKDCGRRSLAPYKGCVNSSEYYLDYPERKKTYFVDDDLRIHIPPPTSSSWSRLLRQPPSHDGSSVQEQERPAQEAQSGPPLQTEPTPPPAAVPHPPAAEPEGQPQP